MRRLVLALLLIALPSVASNSDRLGTSTNGRLKNWVKLPASGNNFTGYNLLARVKPKLIALTEILPTNKAVESLSPNCLQAIPTAETTDEQRKAQQART